MASGAQCKTGVFIGTGAELHVSEPGFKPRYIRLINVSDPGMIDFIEQYDGVNGGVKQVDGATAVLTTAEGITLEDDGFTLGTDTDMNVSGQSVMFACWS